MPSSQAAIFSMSVFGVFLAASLVRAETFIGAKRCQSCHEFEFKMWQLGPHAKAHTQLSKEQLKDPKCNTCHTMLPDNEEDRFLGVQCERCHGPGRYYHRWYVMRDRELARAVGLVDPKPENCRQCHTEGTPSIQSFTWDTMWKRIDHGKAAREAWEKARIAAEPKEK